MPIVIEEERAARTPVLKKTAIGQSFTGALVNAKARDILRRNDQTGADEPVLKPNGKPRQEMVLTFVTMPGTDMPAGLGDDVGVAQPGDIVRLILKGKAFGQYIELKNTLPNWVGDVFTLVTDTAQVYDAQGAPKGGALTTQAEVDAVPRSQTVGIYGTLTKRRATAADQQWVDLAEAAFNGAPAASSQTAIDPDDF